MSWAVTYVGKSAAIAAKVKEEAAVSRCQEPEESFRQTALGLVLSALGSFSDDIAVKVEASGSQWKDGEVVRHNQLHLHVEPIWGFVE